MLSPLFKMWPALLLARLRDYCNVCVLLGFEGLPLGPVPELYAAVREGVFFELAWFSLWNRPALSDRKGFSCWL